MSRKQAAKPADVRATPVPESGWSVVANLIGPLPELHRGQFHGEGPERRFITDCSLVGRHVVDIDVGTNARLCLDCLYTQAYQRVQEANKRKAMER